MKSALLLLFSLLCNALSGDDSICNAHKSRRSFPLTDVGRCPSSHPDEDALLCYENCKSNYNGAGPVCWEKCDGTEIGPICQTQAMSTRAKDSYGRGAGTIPAECGSGKMNVAGLCYDNCRSGYSVWGLFCTKECPSGYEDHGLTCFKWDWFDSDTIWKDSYGIGIGKIPTGCASGKYNENGLCYSHCRSGYVGNGPVCWATCHSGEVDDGAFCRIPEESHLRGSYGRGVGVPLICPAGHEQIALDCYEWCGHDHTGFIGTCTSDKWLDATEAIAASFVPNHFLIAGCSIDTLVKGVMMLDTLSGHDYAGDGFDMCAVDDMLQHIEPTWEAGKGVFAIEFRVGIDLGIPMEQFGFLAQISAIAGKDYTNYDVFRADIAQHADERTLNDLDVFLRWLWDEILDESELNVYVGLAFETHAEGMNVYLYYGHCDGMSMEVGLNQMVYRSVADIVGPQQVHAPTVSLYGVGVGWVYGLDDDCSLKSMGTNLGKGEDGFNVNWEHIVDDDGHQCETVQVIPLNGQSLPENSMRSRLLNM